jgi:hypothetical protein
MRRKVSLAALFVLVAMPTVAAGRCNQPYAPDFRDGASATMQDLRTMRDDAQTFIQASDIYQACLLKSGLQNDTKAKIEANQREKVRVGKAFNTALAAYKVAQKSNSSSIADLDL